MAEWIGQFIALWPSWVVILAVLVLFIVGAAWLLVWSAGEVGFNYKRKANLGAKHGKK